MDSGKSRGEPARPIDMGSQRREQGRQQGGCEQNGDGDHQESAHTHRPYLGRRREEQRAESHAHRAPADRRCGPGGSRAPLSRFSSRQSVSQLFSEPRHHQQGVVYPDPQPHHRHDRHDVRGGRQEAAHQRHAGERARDREHSYRNGKRRGDQPTERQHEDETCGQQGDPLQAACVRDAHGSRVPLERGLSGHMHLEPFGGRMIADHRGERLSKLGHPERQLRGMLRWDHGH